MDVPKAVPQSGATEAAGATSPDGRRRRGPANSYSANYAIEARQHRGRLRSNREAEDATASKDLNILEGHMNGGMMNITIMITFTSPITCNIGTGSMSTRIAAT